MPLWFRRHGYRTLSSGKIFHKFNIEENDAVAATGEANWDGLCEEASTMAGLAERRKRLGIDSHPRMAHPYEGVIDSSRGNLDYGPLDASQERGMIDYRTVAFCEEMLGQCQEKPFFLAAGFVKPHTVLAAPQRFFDLYDPADIEVPEPDEAAFEGLPEMAKQIALNSQNIEFLGGIHYHLDDQKRRREVIHAYLACVSFLDECVGRVIKALECSAHADNTMVVFTSDHGWSLGDHFHWKKWALWESATNVPLIIRRPGDRGGVCGTPVSTIDLYPTLADLCRLPARPEWDGESLMPLLNDGEAPWERPALTTYGPGNHALRTRTATYLHYADGTEELYDPATDRKEEVNLAADPDWREVKEHLRRSLPREEVIPLHRKFETVDEEVAELQDGATVRFGCVAPGWKDRAFTIRMEVSPSRDEALLLHYNGFVAGMALYLRERRPIFVFRNVKRPIGWRRFHPVTTIVESAGSIPEKRARLEVVMAATGEVTIRINEAVTGQGETNGPFTIHPIGNLTVGFLEMRNTVESAMPLVRDMPSGAFAEPNGSVKRLEIEFH